MDGVCVGREKDEDVVEVKGRDDVRGCGAKWAISGSGRRAT